MEKFEYTQCSLNLKKKAIVYRFANCETVEITATEFGGEPAYIALTGYSLAVRFCTATLICDRSVTGVTRLTAVCSGGIMVV